MGEPFLTLGEALRDARERLGRRSGTRVRQADVAEHAGITVEWYARIERGTVLPSFDVLSRIAAALCLSSRERVEALRFVVPDLLRRDDVDPAPNPPGGRPVNYAPIAGFIKGPNPLRRPMSSSTWR
jgi:transcriptional regulator with XRE-family HTH domain